MNFKPAVTDVRGGPAWVTEPNYYAIMADNRHITIQTRPLDSNWMNIMPFEILVKDRGMTVFVVRGIMDALEPIPNEPELAEATHAVQAYLEQLCPKEHRDENSSAYYLRTSDGLSSQVATVLGRLCVYHIRLEHIRRYMKDHAEGSSQGAV